MRNEETISFLFYLWGAYNIPDFFLVYYKYVKEIEQQVRHQVTQEAFLVNWDEWLSKLCRG